MTQNLREKQANGGAIFEGEAAVPSSFGNDAIAVKAAQEGVVLCDRSHWGLIQVSGEDRLQFLHNQSTNAIASLQAGQGCNTVFVTSTARTLDLATVWAAEEAVWLLLSPGQHESMMAWLDRFLFPMDRVELRDRSDEMAVFSLIGPDSERLLAAIAPHLSLNPPEGNHQLATLAETEVRVAVGCGLALPGYTVVLAAEKAGVVWEQLANAGAVPMGDRAWEQLRIQQGRPVPHRELTDDYNPLEAGLWGCISFTKGCYIGQETIARLNTYQGVKQRLWGVRLDALAQPGSAIALDEKKVGTLTSSTATETGFFGLAYIKTKAGGEGLGVQVGDATGELVAVPFLTHEYYVP